MSDDDNEKRKRSETDKTTDDTRGKGGGTPM